MKAKKTLLSEEVVAKLVEIAEDINTDTKDKIEIYKWLYQVQKKK